MDAPRHGMILRPPERHVRPLRQEPLLFFGGPIQSAPDWHSDGIAWVGEHRPEIHIASPRSPAWEKELTVAEEEELFRIQRTWERDYLNYALSFGAVMFWGAEEVKALHRCDRSYAQTTRFEMGISLLAAFMRRRAGFGRYGMPRIAVGLAPGFTNRRYLTQTITEEFGIPVHSSLEATLENAVDIVDESMNDEWMQKK